MKLEEVMVALAVAKCSAGTWEAEDFMEDSKGQTLPLQAQVLWGPGISMDLGGIKKQENTRGKPGNVTMA